MKRKVKIPGMDTAEILKWCNTIRPIVYRNGNPVYLRRLTESEVTDFAFCWLRSNGIEEKDVDFSKLSVLEDVKMIHKWSYFGIFSPRLSEIIRQIPKDLLEKVVAFEIVYSPITGSDFSLFKNEFDQRYHVTVVRLYEAKNDSNTEAKRILKYPNEDTALPRGMSKEEFKKLKDLVAQRC